jgi:tRNA (mo5U34)-methyltransferase
MPADSPARNPEFQRLIRLQTEAFARNTPYHSLELNDGAVIPGIISVEQLRARLDLWPLPPDLRGKRVLDIGAASGWNSFECERRGAEVVAIDYVEYDEFVTVKKLRGSKVEYVIAEMEEITAERFGTFDYVLFFGVLYHLRHPLIGLENVCAVTRGVAFVESFVIDDAPDPSRTYMEFYETDELGGQIDNWCGPTANCLLAMTRAAGFPRAEFLYVENRRCGLIAHRRWEPLTPQPGHEPPFLFSAVNNRHNDTIFQRGKDEYMSFAFSCPAFSSSDQLTKSDVLVEIDEYGIPPIILIHHAAGHWQVNVKLPPGTPLGDHTVRIGTKAGGFSEAVQIRVLPQFADRRAGRPAFVLQRETIPPPIFSLVRNTMDQGIVFRGYREEALECRFAHPGAPLNLSNVQLTVDGEPWPLLVVERYTPEVWQVKANIRGLPAGTHQLRLRTAHSSFSEPFTIESDPVFDLT